MFVHHHVPYHYHAYHPYHTYHYTQYRPQQVIHPKTFHCRPDYSRSETRKRPYPRTGTDKQERRLEYKHQATQTHKRRRGIAPIRHPQLPQVSPTTTKKTKIKAPKGQMDQNLLLENKDILSHIVSFLDIKSLQKFSLASRECRDVIRPDHVVQAALYQGGHARTNMERIVQMYRQKGQHLFAPSTQRMLRLCNGRFCEQCGKNCVRLVSRHWGVFFCHNCLENEGFIVTLKRFDSLYPFVSHLHSIPDGWHAIRLWAKPFLDSDGELCGPRFTLQQCRKSNNKRYRADEALLEKHHERDSARRKAYLPLIESAFETHSKLANDRLRATQRDRHMASAAAQEKKRQRIRWALHELDRGLGNRPWKAEALAHEWVPSTNGKERIQFLAPAAHCVLSRDMAVPSKLTKTRLQSLAVQLIQTYEGARTIPGG